MPPQTSKRPPENELSSLETFHHVSSQFWNWDFSSFILFFVLEVYQTRKKRWALVLSNLFKCLWVVWRSQGFHWNTERICFLAFSTLFTSLLFPKEVSPRLLNNTPFLFIKGLCGNWKALSYTKAVTLPYHPAKAFPMDIDWGRGGMWCPYLLFSMYFCLLIKTAQAENLTNLCAFWPYWSFYLCFLYSCYFFIIFYTVHVPGWLI